MVPLTFEKQKFKQGYSYVVGTDEVGRGCLAGPVVAAAVVFDDKLRRLKELRDVRDSKLLKPSVREKLSGVIKEQASAWSVGVVSSKVIDRVNIHNASLRAMRNAINKLPFVILNPSVSEGEGSLQDEILRSAQNDRVFLFVDGKFAVPNIELEQEAMVDGDAKVFSVACASIVAKVYRDALMEKLHQTLPQYGFDKHKGYGTKYHVDAITRHGLSRHHRKSFCDKYFV